MISWVFDFYSLHEFHHIICELERYYCREFILYFVRIIERIGEKRDFGRDHYGNEGDLGHEGISYCNSGREDRVDIDGVRRESLACKTVSTLF